MAEPPETVPAGEFKVRQPVMLLLASSMLFAAACTVIAELSCKQTLWARCGMACCVAGQLDWRASS